VGIMGHTLRFLLVLCGVLLIAGCSGSMVALHEVNNNHIIDKSLTKDQVKESILEGAKNAGWVAEVQGSSSILATYQIKIHTVQVNIGYSEFYYAPYFKSSIAMKMKCASTDKRHIVSGYKSCPGNFPPYAINANYKNWIDQLNAAIQNSLASK
jgi:hypothetical protein